MLMQNNSLSIWAKRWQSTKTLWHPDRDQLNQMKSFFDETIGWQQVKLINEMKRGKSK